MFKFSFRLNCIWWSYIKITIGISLQVQLCCDLLQIHCVLFILLNILFVVQLFRIKFVTNYSTYISHGHTVHIVWWYKTEHSTFVLCNISALKMCCNLWWNGAACRRAKSRTSICWTVSVRVYFLQYASWSYGQVVSQNSSSFNNPKILTKQWWIQDSPEAGAKPGALTYYLA